jgi:hypothetical protein
MPRHTHNTIVKGLIDHIKTLEATISSLQLQFYGPGVVHGIVNPYSPFGSTTIDTSLIGINENELWPIVLSTNDPNTTEALEPSAETTINDLTAEQHKDYSRILRQNIRIQSEANNARQPRSDSALGTSVSGEVEFHDSYDGVDMV